MIFEPKVFYYFDIKYQNVSKFTVLFSIQCKFDHETQSTQIVLNQLRLRSTSYWLTSNLIPEEKLFSGTHFWNTTEFYGPHCIVLYSSLRMKNSAKIFCVQCIEIFQIFKCIKYQLSRELSLRRATTVVGSFQRIEFKSNEPQIFLVPFVWVDDDTRMDSGLLKPCKS